MLRTIVEERPRNIAIMDVFSKLCQERIIFIDDVIDAELANGVIAQLLYLDSLNNKEISIYINTPGGSVSQGLAIYDISKLIKSPIKTVGIGEVASMGVILLLMGQKRVMLQNTRIMLHQVSSGIAGRYSDLVIELKEAENWQNKIFSIIKEKTTFKNPEKELVQDVWMGIDEAYNCGIINTLL